MDPFRTPIQPNIPPVHLNINEPQTQESNTYNWPPGFVVHPRGMQGAEAAYASFLRDHMQGVNQQRIHIPMSNTPLVPNAPLMSSTPPLSSTQQHTMYYQHCFSTPPVIPTPSNGPTQTDSNTTEASHVTHKNRRSRNKNWRHEEDVSLCDAWVERSENAIVGNCQTSDSFWTHIYMEFCKKLPGTLRTKKGSENKWSTISGDMTKWRGVVKSIQRNHNSGTNVADEWGACYEEFKTRHGYDFKFYHCWEILKHSPKWKISVDKGACSQTSRHVDASDRPPSPLTDFTIGLEGLNETGSHHVPDMNVGDNSALPAMPTEPSPSCVRPLKKKRPIGRTSSKRIQSGAETNAVNEAEVRSIRLCDEVSKMSRAVNELKYSIRFDVFGSKKARFDPIRGV